MKVIIIYYLPSSSYFHLGLNIFLRTLFSNTQICYYTWKPRNVLQTIIRTSHWKVHRNEKKNFNNDYAYDEDDIDDDDDDDDDNNNNNNNAVKLNSIIVIIIQALKKQKTVTPTYLSQKANVKT
jgi:hypothetical protein